MRDPEMITGGIAKGGIKNIDQHAPRLPAPQGSGGRRASPALTQRHELMARFIEAIVRTGSEANIPCMAQWALDLADAVLKAEEA